MTLHTVPDKLPSASPSCNNDNNPNSQPPQDPPTYSPLPEPTILYRDDIQTPLPLEYLIGPHPYPPKPTMAQRFQNLSSKAAWPIHKAAALIGSEEWWPTTMDKECVKAARILHSFTSLGADDTAPQSSKSPCQSTRKTTPKILPAVLSSCAGLAIFNVLRAGACHNSLAAGSGVIISRRPDGTWSPPSAFVITTLGTGFVFGLNVYDCVCVLNTPEQVDAFTNTRFSLGAEGSLALGPVGTGSHVEAALSKTARPVWSYMRSRGVWIGVQIDGTIVVSRPEANGIFYNEKGITPQKILREDVAWPVAGKPLFDVLRAIEGRNFDGLEAEPEVQDVPSYPVDARSEDYQQGQQRQSDIDAKSFEMVNEEDQYETAAEEKERLAKSGY